ncbi:DNA repair protein rad9 [Escovopsis weberi]|uniref:DNA repair protein rad9 n=1 Tax=Escovopsis weberi TaxID=150374 RepID=A0A0M8MWJ9_ESCWE|nr:DNA repair protein rad9 [Escovopsis weberi]
MAVLTFTLSEEAVTAFRDALICLNKFSEDVSLEARKDSFMLTTLNTSKSAYASFKFATNRFFSRYQYQATPQYRDKFNCSLYVRSLISLFRSRSSLDSQRDAERSTLIERCDVAIEDGEGVKSRFIARIVFRNGLTSSHRLPFEVGVPVHAKFSRQESPHHWSISSRTLRQLMDHFGPGIEYLDINTDGHHVNFTCFSEKTVSEDAVLKKPLQTSISVEADEFDDIDVEDKLHIVISVKDFRAIIQHAGVTGNAIAARYSLPARPIQFSYASDAISCEFLIMTVGERGSNNPAQKTRKSRGKSAAREDRPRLEATSPPAPHRADATTGLGAAAAESCLAATTGQRRGRLFVEDEGWEPVRDDAEDEEENARLEWDHSADPDATMRMTDMERSRAKEEVSVAGNARDTDDSNVEMDQSTYVDPTQKLSEVQGLALFPD